MCPSGTLRVMRIVNTADGSRTLYSDQYEQTMHSHRGAVTESRHVFLEGAGVAARLGQGDPARVLEVGFGTGLNFFVTANLALTTHTPLDYVALECDLLSSQVIGELGYEEGLEHKNLLQKFFKARDELPEPPPAGHYAFNLLEGVRLELHLGNATGVRLEPGRYDAVYMDAFSPDANPELWSEDFFGRALPRAHPWWDAKLLLRQGCCAPPFADPGVRSSKAPRPARRQAGDAGGDETNSVLKLSPVPLSPSTRAAADATRESRRVPAAWRRRSRDSSA